MDYSNALTKLERDQVYPFLALLETVNLGTVFDPYFRKTINFGGEAVNAFGSLLNQGVKLAIGKSVDLFEVPKVQVIELEQRIVQQQSILMQLPDEELTNRMKEKLKNKLKISSVDDSELIRQAALVAAKAYKIKNAEYASTPRLVKLVHDRFLEDMLSKSAKQLEKMNLEDRVKVEKAIQVKLEQLDQETFDQLRDVIGEETLTGKAVTTALLRGLKYGSFVGLIELSGFGGYIALTTIVHAIFTTALGITLPFAVYTGLTSFVAFITGPIGILLFTVSGFFLVNSQGNRSMDANLMAMFCGIIHANFGVKEPKPFDLVTGEVEARGLLGLEVEDVFRYPDVKNYLISAEAFIASFESVDTLSSELSPFVITYFKAVENFLCHRCMDVAGNLEIVYTKKGREPEIRQVDFSRETLGDFAYHIANNPGVFLKDKAQLVRIKEEILEYAREIRNSRTHKHALLDWHEVERTKDKTYELLRLLVRECK